MDADLWFRAVPIAISVLALLVSVIFNRNKASSDRVKSFEERIRYLESEVIRLPSVMRTRRDQIIHVSRLLIAPALTVGDSGLTPFSPSICPLG